MRRWFVLAGSLAMFPAFTFAQHHGGMSMGMTAARPAAVSVAAGAHVGPTATPRTSTGTRAATRVVTTHPRSGGTAVRTIHAANNPVRRPANFDDDAGFSEDFNSAPGLGFDEVHFAATRGRRGHRRDRLGTGFFPFFDGGFLFPSSTVIEQAPASEAPPEEAVEPEAQESTRRVRYREPAPAEPAAEAQAESEQYVFVRRDGTVFFAVAYSWDNQTLRYVTQEGLRRSVTREALDLVATQQFNEQRGVNFHLPA
jgi:hypothetical protein